MITDFAFSIISWFLGGLASVLSALPQITIFPAGLATSLASFVAYINGWSWLFPVSTLLTVFGILVLLVVAEFTYFVSMYIFSLIHASLRG